MDQYYLFVTLSPIAAVVALSTAVYAWRRRMVPGALMLSMGLLSNTGWLISSALELISPTSQGTIFIAKFSYLFILSGPVFSLAFTLQYSGKLKWLSYPRFILFWLLPALTFFLVQTNEIHGLIWSNYSVVQVNLDLHVLRISSYGSWFWVHVIYTYSLIFTGILIIGNQHFRSNALYRQQTRWLILGTIAPLVFNIVYILQLIPMLTKDFSSLAFSFSSLILAIGIFRYRLLDIMPIARNIMIENMQEGIIVIDHENRIIDINPTARRLLIASPEEVIGAPLKKYFPETAPLLTKDKPLSQVIEFHIQRDKTKKQLEAKLSTLRNKKEKELGYLLILQDITERKKLYQKIERLASTDSLTNLNNRRNLFILGEKEITRANRYKHPISLMIIDIDHFKEINDAYGHIVGDQVLKHFSLFLQSTLRATDIICRYGGDEFVVVLPETPLDTAHKTALRLCLEISNGTVHLNVGDIHFTLSIGICGLSKVDDTVNTYTLLDQADQALYLAKKQGRNQVVIWNQINKK